MRIRHISSLYEVQMPSRRRVRGRASLYRRRVSPSTSTSESPDVESQDDVSQNQRQNQHPNSSQRLQLAIVTSSSGSTPSNSEGSDAPTTMDVTGNTSLDVTGNTSSTQTLHPDVLWFDHNPVARDVTQSIRSHYDGPYTSWSKVPANVKEIWWKHFRNQYRWDSSVAEAVKRDYERKAAIRLKDMAYKLSKARTYQVIPWCSPTVREQLKQFRASQGFVKKSRLFSANRTSGLHGGTLHCQGSITTAEVIRRMTKELGRAPSAAEVFARSHRTKDNKFVDQRSEIVWEEYQRLKRVHSDTETQMEMQKTLPTDDELFLRAVGGWSQKGTVYGLGSSARTYYEKLPSPSKATDSSEKSTVIELQQQIKDLESSYQKQLAQHKKKGMEMEERLEQQRKEMEEQKQLVVSLKSTMDQLSQFMQSCYKPWSQFQPQPQPQPPPPSPSPPPVS
ncbi:hypothetical protein Ancab_029657 [Ancistrocladus abbreviatus]